MTVMSLFGLITFACGCGVVYAMRRFDDINDYNKKMGLQASQVTDTTTGSSMAMSTNAIFTILISLAIMAPFLARVFSCKKASTKLGFFQSNFRILQLIYGIFLVYVWVNQCIDGLIIFFTGTAIEIEFGNVCNSTSTPYSNFTTLTGNYTGLSKVDLQQIGMINTLMCSDSCPCNQDMQSIMEKNFNETQMNFFGRTHKKGIGLIQNKINGVELTKMNYVSGGVANESYFETFQDCYNNKIAIDVKTFVSEGSVL